MHRASHLLRYYWAELFAAFFGVVGVIDAVANPIGWEGVDKGPDWIVWITPAAVAAVIIAAVKLNLRDRVQAVVFAYENGVVAPGGGE